MSDLLAKNVEKSGKRGVEGVERGPENQEKKSKPSHETVANEDVTEAEMDEIWKMLESDGETDGSLDLDWLDGKGEEEKKDEKKVVANGSEKATEEEKKRKTAEKERQKRSEEQEKVLEKAKKMLKEQQMVKARAEEAKRRENEKKARDAKRKEEEEKRMMLEAKKRAEARRQAEEVRRKRNEEERKKVEEDRKKVEEERKKVEEDRKKVEEERKKVEEDRKMAEEEERKRRDEEKKRKDEEEKKRVEEERKKKDARKSVEEVEREPSSDVVLQSCRQDSRTLAVSKLIVQHTIRTLETVGHVLNGSTGATSSSTPPSTTPIQTFTLLNFQDTNPPSQAAHVILRLLEREGIRCQRSQFSLLGTRTKMPRAEPRRFFVGVVFEPIVARQICNVLDRKVISEARLVDTDLLDMIYLLPVMNYEAALNFELLRIAAESISLTLPVPVRHSIRFTGNSISYIHPYMNPQTVIITVEMALQNSHVIRTAQQVLNQSGRNMLKSIVTNR